MSAKVWALVLLAGAIASAETLGSINTIEQFPSLAQVEFRVQESWLQQCAATILTNRHLLSAATCFSGELYDASYRRVRVGTSTRGVDGQVQGVETARNNPNFGLLGLDSDITVVVLDGYLTFGATVQQTPILGQGIELPGGLVLNHAGWGTTAEGGEVSSADLYALDLVVYHHDNCMIKYITEQFVTENMICVGLSYTSGRDLDLTDIGAPLFYDNTLVGLLSYGKEDAHDEYPVVATAVGSYTSWIIENAV